MLLWFHVTSIIFLSLSWHLNPFDVKGLMPVWSVWQVLGSQLDPNVINPKFGEKKSASDSRLVKSITPNLNKWRYSLPLLYLSSQPQLSYTYALAWKLYVAVGVGLLLLDLGWCLGWMVYEIWLLMIVLSHTLSRAQTPVYGHSSVDSVRLENVTPVFIFCWSFSDHFSHNKVLWK